MKGTNPKKSQLAARCPLLCGQWGLDRPSSQHHSLQREGVTLRPGLCPYGRRVFREKLLCPVGQLRVGFRPDPGLHDPGDGQSVLKIFIASFE